MIQPPRHAPHARALLTSLSLAAIAAGLTLTSGCATLVTGALCAAAGGNGCSSELLADAARVDAEIAVRMVEGASRQASGPRDGATTAGAEAPPSSAGVDISVTGAAPERVSVYLEGIREGADSVPVRGNALVGTCAPPCTLSLPAAYYRFSVGGYSTDARVAIPPVPPRSVRLVVESREGQRVAGWAVFGVSLAAIAGSAVAFGLDDTDPVVVVSTMLGLTLSLLTGLTLGLVPDEVTPVLVF